jgi:GntR family transcriptional regulator
MRPVNREPDAPQGVTDQAAAALRRAIIDGEARQGERLPPATDLAAVLGVNRNTVLAALRALRDEGLVDFRRGRGVVVTATPGETELASRARDLVRFARTRGYEPAEVIRVIQRLG